MRNRLPLRAILILATLIVASLLLIHPQVPTTLAQVGADKRPTPPPKTSPPKPARTVRRSSTSVPRAGAVVRNQMGMELVYVPAGSFMMGSERYDSEKPVHRVTIQEGFYMGRY